MSTMTAADIARIAAEAAKAACLRLMTTDATVTPPPAETPKPATKRKGNPEALKRWRESQKGGTAAAPKAVAKPTAKPVAKTATVTIDAETFKGNGAEIEMRPGRDGKNGQKYVLIYVGGAYVGNLRVDDKRYARAIVNVLRSQAGNDAVAYCDLHG